MQETDSATRKSTIWEKMCENILTDLFTCTFPFLNMCYLLLSCFLFFLLTFFLGGELLNIEQEWTLTHWRRQCNGIESFKEVAIANIKSMEFKPWKCASAAAKQQAYKKKLKVGRKKLSKSKRKDGQLRRSNFYLYGWARGDYKFIKQTWTDRQPSEDFITKKKGKYSYNWLNEHADTGGSQGKARKTNACKRGEMGERGCIRNGCVITQRRVCWPLVGWLQDKPMNCRLRTDEQNAKQQ